VCSKCEPDGVRGERATEELKEIHELAFEWAHAGWLTYEIDWDPRLGVHWVVFKTSEAEDAVHMSLCEFEAFVYGLRVASTRLGAKETGSDV
jgi:hypothetical protein